MGEEDKGFVIKDRRAFNPDGSKRDEEAEEARAGAAEEKEPPRQEAPPRDENTAQAEAGRAQQQQAGPLPPVEFSGLVLSLSHTAMIHLGQIPDPNTGKSAQNLALARHTIDTLAMLKDKTQGNLTQEEQRLIDHALTDLRMAFVQLAK